MRNALIGILDGTCFLDVGSGGLWPYFNCFSHLTRRRSRRHGQGVFQTMGNPCWITALLIAHLCGSAYAGVAELGGNDGDLSPSSPSKPAAPAPSKETGPSVEQTLEFLHRVLPKAASHDKIPYRSDDTIKTFGLNFRARIEQNSDDFRCFIEINAPTPRWAWEDGGRPNNYEFNLSEVSLSEGTSKNLLKSDRSAPLKGVLFKCDVGSCIEHKRHLLRRA